jgi:Domain of unknown function (DUF6647)
MEMLLTTIVLWLSANYGLPAEPEHPRIEFVAPTKIVELRYRAFAGQVIQGHPSAQSGAREIVSVYEDATKTIYLPSNWKASTPAQLSVLVHEMVHHLQNVGKLKFRCPQEREELAYKAQERWLALFGRDLAQDFQLDPFSPLVKTKCGY